MACSLQSLQTEKHTFARDESLLQVFVQFFKRQSVNVQEHHEIGLRKIVNKLHAEDSLRFEHFKRLKRRFFAIWISFLVKVITIPIWLSSSYVCLFRHFFHRWAIDSCMPNTRIGFNLLGKAPAQITLHIFLEKTFKQSTQRISNFHFAHLLIFTFVLLTYTVSVSGHMSILHEKLRQIIFAMMISTIAHWYLHSAHHFQLRLPEAKVSRTF